jgi:hypothetical protein
MLIMGRTFPEPPNMRAHHQFDQTEKIIQTLPKFNAAGVDTFARAIMLSRSAWARRAKSAKTGVNALVCPPYMLR